ncbi:DUF3572 domain-containing protein [Methylocella silvestris]|uniref:DUF3572 domain-containing protein n=1 Tax=Methylocella silvestris TaxID=199596 RepID=A0A2J7TGZ3_METSI|nr:DUF3572 domain-containing protein [Methylocella silvestris]PNG26040.1 hypothetical protein CR492_10630 [Methylocella silvestris]
MQSFGNRRFPGKINQSRERAETLAIEALGYIAGDAKALERFMSLSGLQPDNLRAAAAEPGFLAGVLDFLASDEALLLAFTANAGRNPTEVERAREALAPEAI